MCFGKQLRGNKKTCPNRLTLLSRASPSIPATVCVPGGLERHQYPSLPRGVCAELGPFEIRVTLEGKSGEQV